MQRKARTEAIEQTRLQLEQAEERLFFFDKYDKYEMEKEEKVEQWVRTMPRTDWNLVSVLVANPRGIAARSSLWIWIQLRVGTDSL